LTLLLSVKEFNQLFLLPFFYCFCCSWCATYASSI